MSRWIRARVPRYVLAVSCLSLAPLADRWAVEIKYSVVVRVSTSTWRLDSALSSGTKLYSVTLPTVAVMVRFA
jgi:hypothetical protein